MSEIIGRELKPSELRRRQVVVIEPPGHPGVAITMWVEQADRMTVTFYSGEMNWSVVNFIRPDGMLVDDQNREVKVFEYLGAIDAQSV